VKSDDRYRSKLAVWCAAFELAPEDVIGKSRASAGLVEARHTICWLLRQLSPRPSFPEIGRVLGGRDHTTIMASVRKVEAALAGGEAWAADAVARAGAAPGIRFELEGPLETLRRCPAPPAEDSLESAEVLAG